MSIFSWCRSCPLRPHGLRAPGLPHPLSFYAGLFVCIDVAYNVFEHRVLAHADATQVSARMRRMARRRSLVVETPLINEAFDGVTTSEWDQYREVGLAPVNLQFARASGIIAKITGEVRLFKGSLHGANRSQVRSSPTIYWRCGWFACGRLATTFLFIL